MFLGLIMNYTYRSNEANTVIVGAGPIGLLNAIGLLRLNPHRKLVILEKYDEYKRNHTLQVDYQQVKKYLEACGEPPDPTILRLLNQVKKNKFIRISEMEKMLKQRAIELGAKITQDEWVTDFEKQVRKKYPKADLIIGADGTKSVVSEQGIGKSYALVLAPMSAEFHLKKRKLYLREINGQLAYSVITPQGRLIKDKILHGEKFRATSPLDLKKLHEIKKEILEATTENGDTHVISNSAKKEFDFIMQFRYEVEGDVEKISLPTLMRFMQNYGITADEYVGKKDANGRTPITFQLMITKEQFQLLENLAKSGKPIFPFRGNDPKSAVIPEILMQRIKGYLGLRLRHFTKEDELVRLDEATISVNEAPATYAKRVYKRGKSPGSPDIVVVGDAAMGLSYFKGINAAFEASAKLLANLAKPYTERQQGLQEYQQWFENKYVPKKVKEVAFFSHFIIGATVTVFKSLKFIIRSDKFMRADEAERAVDLYRGHLAHVLNSRQKDTLQPPQWNNAYAHNKRPLNNVLTLLPIAHSKRLKNIGKNATDFIKPYKTSFHFLRDLLTPLRAIYYIVSGLRQMILGFFIETTKGAIASAASIEHSFQKNSKIEVKHVVSDFYIREKEGLLTLVFGITLAFSTLVMPIKLLTRAMSTLFNNKLNLIENNEGIQRLIQQSDTTDLYDDNLSIAKLSSLSVDIHRKYSKSLERGQKSSIEQETEKQLFIECVNQPGLENYRQYFSLFKLDPEADCIHLPTITAINELQP